MLGSAPLMRLLGLPPVIVPELVILLAAGVVYVLSRPQYGQQRLIVLGLSGLGQFLPLVKAPNLADLFAQFFVIGATLFGSGYVLIAYMQRAFVDGLGWLTPQQLLDTIAIGQSTPGPVSSTVSAAGYIMTVTPGNLWSGIPGALAATAGVFLPPFIIVALLGKLIPYMRRYPVVFDFLKGVNAGVIALLIGTFFNLSWATLIRPSTGIDWLSLGLTVMAFILLERFKVSPLLLLALGAATGLVRVALSI